MCACKSKCLSDSVPIEWCTLVRGKWRTEFSSDYAFFSLLCIRFNSVPHTIVCMNELWSKGDFMNLECVSPFRCMHGVIVVRWYALAQVLAVHNCLCVAREWKDKSTQCLPTMRLILLTFHTLTRAHSVCDGFCVIYSRLRLLLFIPHSSFTLCVFREDVTDLDDPVVCCVYLKRPYRCQKQSKKNLQLAQFTSFFLCTQNSKRASNGLPANGVRAPHRHT